MDRTGLTATGFTIHTLIVGVTNIRIVTISYLAVDKSFPYHINLFNDIDINYNKGALTNISGSDSGIRTYSNTINYTILANSIGSTFTKFGTILSKNFVAVFLSAIYNDGSIAYNPLP
jgi:hypothetical protein